MDEQKSVIAKIYDLEDDKFLSEIPLTITLLNPSDENKKPSYDVSGRFETMKLDFCDKNFLLELSSSLRGPAFFSLKHVAGMFTIYKITLEDSMWWNTDWFNDL